MKKLGKIKLTDMVILDASEMKRISGGSGDGRSGYRCACGMGQDTYFAHWNFGSMDEAMNWVASHCEYGVGGCFY